MDTFIISKISNYFPVSKNYQLAKEIKNKSAAKVLFEKCHKHTGYVAYTSTQGLRVVSIPTLKSSTDYPKLNYDEMCSKGINNAMFFFKNKDKTIHSFQFMPYLYTKLTVEEEIEEATFYEIDERSFWLVVNHTHIYKFVKFKRTKKIALASGYFFEENLIDNMLCSDFFGEEIVIQDLDNSEAYKLKFKNNTYFDIISKDMIIIDFSFHESILDDVLPQIEIKLEEKKNALFKYHLVKGTPNKITLEFVSFLPQEIKLQKICSKLGYYYSRNDEKKQISIYKLDKEISTIKIPDLDEAIAVMQLDEERLLIEYATDILLIDIVSGKISAKINMKERIKKLLNCGVIERVGDYYNIVVLTDGDDETAWKQYVLDQNFSPIYEIEEDKYFMYSD